MSSLKDIKVSILDLLEIKDITKFTNKLRINKGLGPLEESLFLVSLLVCIDKYISINEYVWTSSEFTENISKGFFMESSLLTI